MEPLDCDYKIISIDSLATTSNATLCHYYIDLDEPLRNVVRINIITMLLNINNSSTIITGGSSSGNLESVYVDLNNYNRLISKSAILDSTGKRSNIYFFDSLIIEKADTTSGGNMTIKNDYNTTDSKYYLNPIEPQLKRFTVRLFNKNNVIIDASAINRFIMKIGVYYNNKKSTRL